MNFFLYGTLKDRELLAIVSGEAGLEPLDATLSDHAVESEKDGILPVLVRCDGAIAHGLLLCDVTDAVAARLDAYEAPFGYVRRSVQVRAGDRMIDADVYDAPVGCQSHGVWSLEEWAAKDRDITLLTAQEFALFPPDMPHDEIARQWGMMRGRASATLRAASLLTTHRLRSAPRRARFVREVSRAGGFFRFAQKVVEYETFAGKSSGELPREVFIGPDAALVLAYDPKSDNVLLVEQVRMGPLAHGNPNPWCLEPIAGMVDGGETPEQAAHREGMEEAGLRFSALIPMFSQYASPGNATDYFYCFLGITDLPEVHSYSGGLEEEAEDLKLHIVPFDQALGLIDTGEINVGPAIAMLLWLDRKRPELRASA